MGTTIRRAPNLTQLPKKVTPHYENIINFKGLHITDNPFTADSSSASDLLNVYIDDTNALTVRPRLDKSDDLDAVVGTYTLVKIEPLTNGKILLLMNGTTPVIKLVINNVTYTVSGIGTINPYTCSFYEDGDISTEGKIYLFDENGTKYIKKQNSSYVCGSISDIAYIPTVEVNKDITLNTSTKKDPYNVFTNKYKISYSTPTTPYDYSVDFAVGKSAVINTNDASYETDNYKKHYSYLTNGVLKEINGVYEVVASKDGSVVLYNTKDDNCYISTNYGKTFDTLFCSENDVLLPIKATHIAISGDGSTILTITSDNILKVYKNRVLWVTEDLNNLSYSGHYYLLTTAINNVHITIDYLGTTWAISPFWLNETNGDVSYDDRFEYVGLFTTNVVNNNVNVTKTMIAIKDSNVEYKYDTTGLLLNDDGTYCALLYNYRNVNFRVKFLKTSTSVFSNYTDLDQYTTYYELLWKTNSVFVCKKSQTQLMSFVITDVNTITTNTYTTNTGLYMVEGFFINTANGLYYIFATGYTDSPVYKITFTANNITNVDVLSLLSNTYTQATKPRKYAIVDGFWYIINGGDNKIYSNNAYTVDKDWLSVVYTDYTTPYALNNATKYALWQDKLWLYGVKNLLGWTGVNDKLKRDFTYIPDNQVFELGIDTTPLNEKTDITGFNVIGDNVASAYKRDKIYLITPTTVSNIDTYMYSECKAEQGNIIVGETVTTPLTALPIQINRDGVFALTNLTNVYAADKIATLISAKINEKFLKEDLSNLKVITFKYWLLIFIPGDITHVYVYDDRSAEWFYWELPIKVLNVFKTHDDLYCVADDNQVYKLNPKEKVVAINSDDAVTLYYDDVYVEGADNCFDAYGVQGKNIVWYWTSQTIPLNSISYAKQLNKTTFIVADSDAADGYAFNYSIKGWRKKRTLVKSSDLDGTVYSIQATTKRTNVNRAHFIQLTITNAMLENHQLMLNKTLKTDIDTNDQKVRLIGVSMKYKYLEV